MNSRLLMLLHEAQDLSVEIGAVLLDEDLRNLAARVGERQQEVALERRAVMERLHEPLVWADKQARARLIRRLAKAHVQADKLERLEDAVQAEQFARAQRGRTVQVTQAEVLEVTRRVAISHSGDFAA